MNTKTKEILEACEIEVQNEKAIRVAEYCEHQRIKEVADLKNELDKFKRHAINSEAALDIKKSECEAFKIKYRSEQDHVEHLTQLIKDLFHDR